MLTSDGLTRVRPNGITLIELMIVVVIISILSLFALPSYRAVVQRSQRIEAKRTLMRLASNQEKFFIQHDRYSPDLPALGFAVNRTENSLYALAIVLADDREFLATATIASGSNAQDDDECRQFAIDQTGRRTAAPNRHGDCW